jgi:hypothetical protein
MGLGDFFVSKEPKEIIKKTIKKLTNALSFVSNYQDRDGLPAVNSFVYS